jgi:hypothetical protein
MSCPDDGPGECDLSGVMPSSVVVHGAGLVPAPRDRLRGCGNIADQVSAVFRLGDAA